MREKIFISSSLHVDRINKKKIQIQTRYESISLICFGGGFLGLVMGLSFLFASDFADKSSVALKHCGLSAIFAAAVMLGCGAHFMDKLEVERRQIRKVKREQFNRKEIL